MITLPNPAQLTLSDWADQVCFYLDSFGSIPRLVADEWQEWASAVLRNHSLPCSNPPNPYNFTDWREWARRFCEVIN